jgi:acyl carrier protein
MIDDTIIDLGTDLGDVSFERVCSLIIRSTETDLSSMNLTRESNFKDDLLFDSISFLTLALYLAGEFKLDISQDYESYFRIKTVGDLIDFLDSKLG